MARSTRIAQWYGYAVCLVAVITFLLSARGIVDDLFTLSDPLRAGSRFGTSFTSFESYRATQDLAPRREAGDTTRLSDSELRQRYEALRSDHVGQVRFDATRGLVASVLMLLIAVGLFVWHWRWLRNLPSTDAADA